MSENWKYRGDLFGPTSIGSYIFRLLTRYKNLMMDEELYTPCNDNSSATKTGVATNYGSTEQVNNYPRYSNNAVCELVVESFPNVNNYKDDTKIKRPSLADLHEQKISEDVQVSKMADILNYGEEESSFKLGWIQGVLIPCLLNIWGVMLFLRMPWIVAQAGIFQAIIVIVVATFVCMLTTLSLSALCTNGEVKGGGIYFIISRSLGPEFGASIGIVLVFANAVSASMNTIGFCDSLNDLLISYYDCKIFENPMDSVRVVGVVALLVMIVICAVGIEWESKAQNILIFLIVFAMGDFFVGTVNGPDGPEEKNRGFEGISWERIRKNWKSEYTYSEDLQQSIFSIFAIFFPSVTGIHAGANISGDLKDPSSAIPKGTLLSLLISMISYIATAFLAGAASVRSATGNSTQECHGECRYGLYYDFSIMQMMAVWGLVIYIGCFAATLSTALTNLITVPRLIQALGDDRVYPGLQFFSKQYGKSKEPYRGYVLTFIISAIFVLVAKLNAIAPLISNFYLASYALINFCTFHAEFIQPLGWRPTFQYYNIWVSLFSGLLCLVIMFLLDWQTSLATFIIFFALYLLVMYRQPDANWGSSTQAQIYNSALASSHRLTNVNDHVKNYRPQILLLSGAPNSRPSLMYIAYLITKHNSLLISADIIKEKLSYRQRSKLMYNHQKALNEQKIKAFSCIMDGLKFEDAVKSFVQCCGIGKLRPNILMMGYKNNWFCTSHEDLQSYFSALHCAFDNCFGVTILRMPQETNNQNGQKQHYMEAVNLAFDESDSQPPGRDNNEKYSVYTISHSHAGLVSSPLNENSTKQYSFGIQMKGMNHTKQDKIVETNVTVKCEGKTNFFQQKKKSGFIDVWWLYDDGGLTMLLPYILKSRSIFSKCQLRIFALTNKYDKLEEEEKNMSQLLEKFRIKYFSLTMITDVTSSINSEHELLFNELIKPFRMNSASSPIMSGCFVTNEEIEILAQKTRRQLRLRELLLQHSQEANLVVMSLPMPKKGLVSAPVYMAWLEILTRSMPPFLFVRGNQKSVLTFYS